MLRYKNRCLYITFRCSFLVSCSDLYSNMKYIFCNGTFSYLILACEIKKISPKY